MWFQKMVFVQTYSHLGGKTWSNCWNVWRPTEKNLEKAKNIAMHVAAMDPKYLSEEVTAADLEHEKKLLETIRRRRKTC